MTDQDRILQYLDDTLSPIEKTQLEARLDQDPALRQILLETRQLLQIMDQVPDEQPPASLQTDFMHTMTREFPHAFAKKPGFISSTVPGYWRAIAASVLVVLGLSLGVLYQLNQQQRQQIDVLAQRVQQTQHLLALSMLEQPSAAQRIKAVNTIQQEITQPNPEVITALIERMRTDPHLNVRMKAVEALAQFPHVPAVVPALTRQLSREEHPQVLLTLIDVLVALQAQPAAPAMEELLKSNTQPEVVRNRAAYGMGQLL